MTFILGIIILPIGILWFVYKRRKERKKNIAKTESKDDYWFGIEDAIDIWGLIIVGIGIVIYSFLII